MDLRLLSSCLVMEGISLPCEAIEDLQKMDPILQVIGYTNLTGFINAQFKVSEGFGITKEEGGAHAGEIETSLILSMEQNLVSKDRYAPGYLGPSGDKEIKIVLEQGMPALSKKGVLGDPTKADAKRGKDYLERTVDFLIKEIKKQLKAG